MIVYAIFVSCFRLLNDKKNMIFSTRSEPKELSFGQLRHSAYGKERVSGEKKALTAGT